MDLQAHLVAAVEDARPEAARRAGDHLAGEDDGDVVGAAERELVAEYALEPFPAGLGTVEDARVGELELAERDLVAVAALAVLVGEGTRERTLTAAEEGPDVAGLQAGADRRQRLGVGAGAEAVVERLKGKAGLGRLALRPLVPVQAEPDRIGGVAAALPERRAPLAVVDIEVVVVGQGRLAAELEVGMGVRAALAPAPPDACALLGDADQDAAEAPLALGSLEVRTGDLLLRDTLAERTIGIPF